MLKLWVKVSTFLRKNEGQSMVEYGLILALIALVCITAVALIGTHLQGLFNHIATNLTT